MTLSNTSDYSDYTATAVDDDDEDEERLDTRLMTLIIPLISIHAADAGVRHHFTTVCRVDGQLLP